MKKIILGISALLLLVFLLAENAFAGAWTIPQFKLWTEQYAKLSWSDKDFNEESRVVNKNNDGKSWSWEIEPKFEFGFTDWLTGIFSFTYTEAHYKEYDRPAAWGPYSVMNNGVKDVKYGVRCRLLKEPIVTSLQFKIYQYTGYDNPSAGTVEGQPMLGRGDDAFEVRGQVGKTFNIPFTEDLNLPCYAGLETGWRLRNRDVANDFPFFVEAGFWPFRWLLLKGEIDGYAGQSGTGVVQSYAIWRAGVVFHLLSTTQQNRDKNLINVELQYGRTFWAKGGSADTDVSGSVTADAQEIVAKLQIQF